MAILPTLLRSGRSALLLAALLAALGVAVPRAGGEPDVSVFAGLATWVDIYDDRSFANPEAAVRDMAARGVQALYLETSNYSRAVDVFRPDRVARFVDAAHDRGIAVVAWYLPGFRNMARDRRRSLAAIRFRTPTGERFDAFALDIEASIVKPPSLRSARTVRLGRELRAAVGPSYPLGAIIPSPRGMELKPKYWPAFPYRGLNRSFDAFLPMVYYSYRTSDRPSTADYVARSIEIIQTESGDPDVPIHVIGGIADRSKPGQTRGFVAASCAGGVIGLSLYDFETTRAAQWPELRRFPDC
jgi:hypothetical protein